MIEQNPASNPETIELTPMSRKQLQDALEPIDAGLVKAGTADGTSDAKKGKRRDGLEGYMEQYRDAYEEAFTKEVTP